MSFYRIGRYAVSPLFKYLICLHTGCVHFCYMRHLLYVRIYCLLHLSLFFLSLYKYIRRVLISWSKRVRGFTQKINWFCILLCLFYVAIFGGQPTPSIYCSTAMKMQFLDLLLRGWWQRSQSINFRLLSESSLWHSFSSLSV